MRVSAKAAGCVLLTLVLGSCAAPASNTEKESTAQLLPEPTAEIVIRSEAPPITVFTEETTNTPAPSTASTETGAAVDVEQPAGEPVRASGILELLEQIPVKGRAPKTGYDRDLFGSGWGDPDHNGCDARNDILARDLTVDSYKPGTDGCVVLTGALTDPYTGKTIDFQRGQGTSTMVQIDHVVALSDAWQKGAQQLSAATRYEFANDPLNLLAVDGPTNASKGDSDAASWLPPNRGYWCAYVTRQVEVKHKYDLWMTQAEHQRSDEVLSNNC